MHTTRRHFCSTAAAFFLTTQLPAQTPSTGSSTRPNVAALDHDRILAAADHYLTQPPAPLTTLPSPDSPGTPQDYFSQSTDSPAPFTAHRDALLSLAHIVPALASAWVITKDERYAQHAVAHLQAWFVSPETSMTPSLEYAQVAASGKARPEGVIEAVHLAEVAQSIPFLSTSEALTEPTLDAVTKWFTSYLEWLNTSRTAGLARDMRDHNGSSWLLQAAACAHLNLKDDRALTALRHQFKASTIRAQITYDGTFPRELTTPNPYRNSLFNLDLLAGACELLTTRFETVWDYELQDGPSMRIVLARLFPYIARRGSWPYKADAAFFNELPLRRPALLFAARAYNRPEYADLWKTLPPDTDNPELDRTFPIRQPLLWVTRPRP
ncbi:alginate lyase family protein [Edaphobacter aggregans]|uniref:alginate lyase family protein n=1 Tax=Edaphobacter aggregans TaxID=570835 RepID=UPI0005574C76|nr:alginate lyase family protein [Edaphobacter aggregans]